MHEERVISPAVTYLISILMLSLLSISYSIRIIALRFLVKVYHNSHSHNFTLAYYGANKY